MLSSVNGWQRAHITAGKSLQTIKIVGAKKHHYIGKANGSPLHMLEKQSVKITNNI